MALLIKCLDTVSLSKVTRTTSNKHYLTQKHKTHLYVILKKWKQNCDRMNWEGKKTCIWWICYGMKFFFLNLIREDLAAMVSHKCMNNSKITSYCRRSWTSSPPLLDNLSISHRNLDRTSVATGVPTDVNEQSMQSTSQQVTSSFTQHKLFLQCWLHFPSIFSELLMGQVPSHSGPCHWYCRSGNNVAFHLPAATFHLTAESFSRTA